jgi:hypothetical protein
MRSISIVQRITAAEGSSSVSKDRAALKGKPRALRSVEPRFSPVPKPSCARASSPRTAGQNGSTDFTSTQAPAFDLPQARAPGTIPAVRFEALKRRRCTCEVWSGCLLPGSAARCSRKRSASTPIPSHRTTAWWRSRPSPSLRGARLEVTGSGVVEGHREVAASPAGVSDGSTRTRRQVIRSSSTRLRAQISGADVGSQAASQHLLKPPSATPAATPQRTRESGRGLQIRGDIGRKSGPWRPPHD